MPAAREPGHSADLGPYAPWGVDRSGIDGRARPGDDFFRYANGAWLDRTEIPPDLSAVGIDQQIGDGAQEIMRAILDGADERGPETDLAKAQGLYRSYLDEAAVEAAGSGPIRDALVAIRAASSLGEIAALMGRSHRVIGGSLFDLTIRPDQKAPDRYAVTIHQAGLGLPDRTYYADDAFAPIRSEYRSYLSHLLALVGWEAPDKAAAAILAFETEVAEASWPLSDARDAARTYNPVQASDLAASSGFPWRSFLRAAGLDRIPIVILGQPSAIAALGGLVGRTSLPILQAWLAAHLVDEAAPYLSGDFVRAHDAFRSGILTGATETAPRWRSAIALVDTLMGEAVAPAYVDRAVAAGTKLAVEAMVETLRAVFAARIRRLDWMSEETKVLAADKLARMGRKIAYPDRWRSYADVRIRPADLFGNVLSCRAVDWDRRTGRLDRPVVREEWFMPPQTTDAAYSVSLNEVLVPAAELQAPFFHPAADAAVNYGGIGAIIGHEMTHGFDDDGRRFDAEGRFSDWWPSRDSEAFDREANRLAAQLDRTEVLPGLFIDGRLTLNEAMADLGGASIALDAYRLSLEGRPAPVIDGLTGDHRFFLAFAQAWRWKEREAALRARLASDPHAPPETRVNGTVRNIDAWYEAFGIGPGDGLYLEPGARVRLW